MSGKVHDLRAMARELAAERSAAPSPGDTGEADAVVRVVIRKASEIEAKPINWLWDDWLACGFFHLLAGRQKTGKTSLALTLAARLSVGKWPFTKPGKALLAMLEDNIEHVLMARLERAGGDPENVHFTESVEIDNGRDVHEARLRLESHLDRLAEAARGEAATGEGYGLIVLDPVLRVAGGQRDTHNANQIRTALDPVEALAQATGAAVLGITHMRKQQAIKAGSILDSVMGSGAWTHVARVVWVTFPTADVGGDFHANDYEYCLGLGASNLGPDRALIPYDIRADESKVTRIEFGEQQAVSATAILEERPPSALDQAENWIKANIPPGEPILAAEVKAGATRSGHSWRTMQTAKSACNVESVKREGQWYWLRPE